MRRLQSTISPACEGEVWMIITPISVAPELPDPAARDWLVDPGSKATWAPQNVHIPPEAASQDA